MTPVQIIKVWGGTPWWKVQDSTGVIHATKSRWLASLADQYAKNHASVHIDSASGWYFRELHAITPVGSLEQVS